MINTIFLSGNTGYVRVHGSQKDATKSHVYFSCCQNRRFKDGTEKSYFWNCAFYNAPDFIQEHLVSGVKVLLQGSLSTDDRKEPLIVVNSLDFTRIKGMIEDSKEDIPF